MWDPLLRDLADNLADARSERADGAPEPASDACPKCEGRGWVLVDDGGAGAARPCSCRQEGRGDRLREAAGIPRRYRTCRLSTFSAYSKDAGARQQLSNAVAKSMRYCEDFLRPGGDFVETGLLFYGPPGVGKTHLAVAILLELIESYGVRGRFVDFSSLIHQLQSSFDPGSPESKRTILDPVAEAEVLVLDELGAQKPTPWVQEMLYLIINSRYTNRLPTLFTTNYSLGGGSPRKEGGRAKNLDRGADPAEPAVGNLGQLSSRVPPRLVSRLYEMADSISLMAVSDHRSDSRT